MRLLVLSVSVLCAACLGATCATAQTVQWGQAEDQIPPFLTHVDRRHGHDHVYPDRGAVVRGLPKGATAVNYAGISYRFAGGIWYQSLGPAYMVVAPPIGLIVPQLPPFATSFDSGGKTYLYANDVFYRPRPDLGGYEVVNDPDDTVPQASQAPAAPITGAAPATGAAAPATGAAPVARAAPAARAAPSPAPIPMRPPVQAKNVAAPPAPAATPSRVAAALPNPTRVVIHPRSGQSEDQQASDRYDCYRSSVAQTGFDPLASNSGTSSAGTVAQRNAEYSRAQAACLEQRGYTVQ